mgnify:CR=1 FL=1
MCSASTANAHSSEEIGDDKSIVYDQSRLAVEKASGASRKEGNFNTEELKIDVSSSSSSNSSSPRAFFFFIQPLFSFQDNPK